MRAPIASLLALVLLASCGNKWGRELRQTTPLGEATIYHSEAVDEATARKVFQVMLDSAYNFASNLPEQIDKVDGRITLRLGNDNEDSLADVAANEMKSGVSIYCRHLAWTVSKAIDGQPVDIVLCRKSLDEQVYTVRWDPETK